MLQLCGEGGSAGDEARDEEEEEEHRVVALVPTNEHQRILALQLTRRRK